MWAYASRLKQCTHTATRGKGASDLSKSARRQSRRIAHQGRAGPRTGDMGGGYTYDFGRLFESDPVGGSKHEATVFMLHGLGDTGDGWSFAGNQLRIPGVRWVYPTAPTRPISCNGGMPMPGWFDIKNLPLDASALDEGGAVSKSDLDRHVDGSGVEESVRYLLDLVRKEVEERKIPAEKIVLGGFSQGGHVVARAALECDLPIAGCVVLSSWVGHPAAGGAKRRLPFFVGHGEADPMVPAVLAKKSDDLLRSLGHDVTFRTYAGVGHSCNMEELDDLKDFLVDCLEDKAALPPMEEAASLSAGKLKQLLVSRGVDVTGCLEKGDLVEKLKSLY